MDANVVRILVALVLYGLASVCISASTTETCESETATSSPHIILILADDLGYNDISWNNADVPTPHLSALAADGIILDRNYMSSTCAPSRGTLLTGRYPFRIGLQHGNLLAGSPACLSLNETLLPEHLREAGYATHLLGKWHLGFSDWECTPLYRGFDTFYGFYSPYLDHYLHTYEDGYDWRDGNEIDLNANGTYDQDLITTRAKEIIAAHDCDQPIFMMFSSSLPHYPWQLPPGVEIDDPENGRDVYVAMISYLDSSIGEVLDALKEKGLYNNSVIIFTSENGAQPGGSGSNFPLRSGKASVYEGGTRVPAMVHSPLMNAEVKGQVSQEFMHVTDWLPTILALAGSSADLSAIDGVDQTLLLLEGGPSVQNESVYQIDQYYPQTLGAATIRVGNYKLIVGFPGMLDGWEQVEPGICFTYQLDLLSGGVPPAECGFITFLDAIEMSEQYISQVEDNVMLFNIIDDPNELVNLAVEEPELVAMMRGRLEELIAQAAPLDLTTFIPDPDALPALHGGIWTPTGPNPEQTNSGPRWKAHMFLIYTSLVMTVLYGTGVAQN